MRVRVKYCGGCNPRYDRKAALERLQAAFPDDTFVATDDGGGPFDHVVVLCGCPAACASHEDLRGRRGKTVVTSEEESLNLEEILRSVAG